MTSDQAVTAIKQYLDTQQLGMPIFKYESKPFDYRGEYVAVNCLPVALSNIGATEITCNLNVHVPVHSDGVANYARLETLTDQIASLFIGTNYTSANKGVQIKGLYYYVAVSGRSPLKDLDNTYFKNLKIKTHY